MTQDEAQRRRWTFYEAVKLQEEKMFGFGAGELVVIGIILFFLFGAKRLPERGKGLGGAVREFKKVKKDLSLNEEGDSRRHSASPKEIKASLEEKTEEKKNSQ